MRKSGDIDGIIVELHRVGNAVKVSVVDTRTYLEVSIIAPAGLSERQMEDNLLGKLAWVRSKQSKKMGESNARPR